MNWPEVQLGDISELVYGKALRGYVAEKTDEYPARVFGTNGPIGWAKEALTDKPTVIVGRKGAYRGIHFSDIPCWTIDTAFYTTVDPERVDMKWLYYRLLLVDINRMNSGAAIPSTRREDFYSLKIRIPNLGEQSAIVSILSAYDELIENNRRRIALLEEAARQLYREWFVHFRFPGHEHVRSNDGLPEGWQRVPLSRLATIFRGKSYKSSELVEDGGQPFINLKCFKRGGGFRSSGLKWFRGKHKEHHKAEAGDIVIAVTDMTRDAMIVSQAARVPKSVGENAIYSMDLVKAVPRDIRDLNWLYGMLRFSRFSAEVREEATGATVLHLKPKHIENWLAPVPPTTLRELFSRQFASILDQSDNLEMQNQRLAQARDLLLPRLMSGEIAV